MNESNNATRLIYRIDPGVRVISVVVAVLIFGLSMSNPEMRSPRIWLHTIQALPSEPGKNIFELVSLVALWGFLLLILYIFLRGSLLPRKIVGRLSEFKIEELSSGKRFIRIYFEEGNAEEILYLPVIAEGLRAIVDQHPRIVLSKGMGRFVSKIEVV